MSRRRLSCFASTPTEEETTLTSEQLEMLEIWHLCGMDIDVKTFWQIWTLSEYGIPPHVIVTFLSDVSKYFIGRNLRRQKTM